MFDNADPHEELTLAAIEDILARGSLPDWAPLVRAIEADPHGEVEEKTLRICTTGTFTEPRNCLAA
jgi:hypothetical protein